MRLTYSSMSVSLKCSIFCPLNSHCFAAHTPTIIMLLVPSCVVLLTLSTEAFPIQTWAVTWHTSSHFLRFFAAVKFGPNTLGLVTGLKGKHGCDDPVNNWWLWWWWRQLFVIGEILSALLDHCDWTGAVLATDIKCTVIFIYCILCVDTSEVILSEHQFKIANLLHSRKRKEEICTIEKLEQGNRTFLLPAKKEKNGHWFMVDKLVNNNWLELF